MNRFLAWIAVQIVFFLLWTCKIEIKGREAIEDILNSKKYIYASWHGRLILFFLLARVHNTAVITSNSKDGALAAAMQDIGGCAIFRGSSKKGGKNALEKITDYMNEKKRPAMLSVDGPTGPIFKSKIGVAKLSLDTGFPIIPITFSGKKVKVFRSWDRCMIPKPFSKCTITFDKPIYATPDKDLEKTIEEVDESLNRITLESDKFYGIELGLKKKKS